MYILLSYQYIYETSDCNITVNNDVFWYMSCVCFGMIGIHTW